MRWPRNQKRNRHAVLNEASLLRLSDTRNGQNLNSRHSGSQGGICWTRNQNRRKCRELGQQLQTSEKSSYLHCSNRQPRVPFWASSISRQSSNLRATRNYSLTPAGACLQRATDSNNLSSRPSATDPERSRRGRSASGGIQRLVFIRTRKSSRASSLR